MQRGSFGGRADNNRRVLLTGRVGLLVVGLCLALARPCASQSVIAYEFDRYAVALRHDGPFGITSLRHTHPQQTADFAHFAATDAPSSLPFPIGDWEWFWLGHYREGDHQEKPFQEKVMVTPWPPPAVQDEGERVILRFAKHNVLIPGITLRQDFSFSREEATFVIAYRIENGTPDTLRGPYCMLGFPGFMNHRAATEVWTANSRRAVERPYASFYEEALARGLYQYLLLRDDWYKGDGPTELRGQVDVTEGQFVFSLLSRFVPSEGMTHVYSAHTNKELYLTSHLYVYLEDIPPSDSRSLVVTHQMFVAVESAVLPSTWGWIKSAVYPAQRGDRKAVALSTKPLLPHQHQGPGGPDAISFQHVVVGP